MDGVRRFQVAFSLLPFGKPGVDKALLNYAGSPEAVFRDPSLPLLSTLPLVLQQALSNRDNLLREADHILDACVRIGSRVSFQGDPEYPCRLTFCEDAPLVVYYKGTMALNAPRVLCVVGTRKPTPAGREWTEALIQGLASHVPDVVIVSGLAYGIDIYAHTAALNNHLATVAVLAHGLDTLYPPVHAHTAKALQNHGCLLSELKPGTEAEGWRFLQRNRIVAGVSDACIVVESGEKGGSLNTANKAFYYGRPVFSRPGRPSDNRSVGCNNLIKRQVSQLADTAEDILLELGWLSSIRKKKQQEPALFRPMTAHEERVVRQLSIAETIGLNDLVRNTGLCVSEVLAATMQLELDDAIEALPGNYYRLRKRGVML